MDAMTLCREKLDAIAKARILILDGAMGSQIQTLNLNEADFRGNRFINHPIPLLGCNDLLCLTKPDAISKIHEAYLEAGADIIETCSFCSTSISLADYGIGELAYEISAAAATLARRAADKYSTGKKPRFVAGSMGPTAKSASLPPDMDDPARRGVYWEQLEAAYYDNARGLLDGGVDILIVETVFDGLNAKAALFAISRLLEERGIDVPVIVSATVSDTSGRLLSGQSLEAFCVSVMHARSWALGLNCSFGAEKLLPSLQKLAACAPCLCCAYPNAGMPNQFGAYDETPQIMASLIEKYLQLGLVNIIGGCCGTTPAHIAAIAEKAAAHKPRNCTSRAFNTSALSGLETLPLLPNVPQPSTSAGLAEASLHPDSRLPIPHSPLLIGERANVAGSREFLRFISEKKYTQALGFVRGMIQNGAAIINVGMDDALLDAEAEMKNFLYLALSDPEIAKVPFMIDSSRWNVIEAGLKCVQGKPLVNSISLKDGEAEFLRRAKLVMRYGAAVVVMLIDEQGQAASYERKIEIAGRAYQLLTKSNLAFPPENIVFDPNVLAIATGINEHDSYALDFIRACSWIRENCPGAHISGGISNLSFSFRGNNAVRGAMHSVFLKHACEAGLDMAIVNPAALIPYEAVEPELRTAAEDLILNRRPDAAKALLEIAERGGHAEQSSKSDKNGSHDDWRNLNVKERIIHAIVKGIDEYIQIDVLALRETEYADSPLAIVEGPLMAGIGELGRCFGEGKMYLPQVIRGAMVMKKAVTALESFITAGKNNTMAETMPLSANAGTATLSAKIVLATVKGDVHDIGKNIVGLVLGCNGHTIIDLGVMAPADKIIETAVEKNAVMIGLSGLISPSLDQMILVAREMEKRGLRIPLLIGGAAANLAHTALKIAPEYSGPVIYVPDAAQAAGVVKCLLSDTSRPGFLETIAENYNEAVMRHETIQSRAEIIPIENARANKIQAGFSSSADDDEPANMNVVQNSQGFGFTDFNDYPADELIPHIDWQAFLQTWELAENTYPQAYDQKTGKEKFQAELLNDAEKMLKRIKTEGLLRLQGIAGLFPAASDGDDVVLFEPDGEKTSAKKREIARFCFLRNQEKKRAGAYNPCLADFFKPLEKRRGKTQAAVKSGGGCGIDRLGLFALSAGFGLKEAQEAFHRQGDDYGAILLATLANALADAFAVAVHSRFQPEKFPVRQGGIRPVFGYPISPDHEDKRLTFALLDAANRCGLELTETAMMIPAASVCGMLINHPAAYYFGVGKIGEDQLRDWARRKGISPEEARQRVGG
jgi:5-methyltetrahydrofolate--homocysteine methyltransferase